MLQYFLFVTKLKCRTHNIVSYMVEAFNSTYPVDQHKIIQDNESCWQYTAQVWAQVRTLQNNIALKVESLLNTA
jgi:hypothetical protein